MCKLAVIYSILTWSKLYVPQDFRLLSLSSFSPIPQHQIMATETPQQGESGAKMSQSTGDSTNASLAGTQQQHRHQKVHHWAANTATDDMTSDELIKIICKSGLSKNMKQRAIRCDYIHIEVNSRQLTIYHTMCICGKLHNQLITACHRKPPWLTKALIPTIRKIKHHVVVSARMFADDYRDKHPRECTKHTLVTWEVAVEANMVQVVAKSHC